MKKKKAPKKTSFVCLREKSSHNLLDVYTHNGREYSTPNGMPSEVTVYGAKYEVRYHSNIYSEPKKSQRLRGIVLYNFRLIVIDPRQSIHDLRETLFHEMGHVYVKAWQSKSLPLSKLTYQQVEDICDMFAEGHYDALSCKG